MKEEVEWYKNINRPSVRDGHILAMISGQVYAGVYFNNHFIPDQIDFVKRGWYEVEMWCWFPRGGV